MLYRIINSSKQKYSRGFIHIFIIISYLATHSGCMSTYNYSSSPDNISSISPDEITKIELIDGSVIYCKNKTVMIERGADSVKYILVKSLTGSKDSNTNLSEKRISEKDIFKIHIEHSKINSRKTALLVLVTVAAIGIIVLIIGISTAKMNIRL